MESVNSDIFENPKAFRQQVRLAAQQVAALGDGELAGALAYELEPFSKIPAADADVAWRETPESNSAVKVYDVAVMPRRAKKSPRLLGDDARRLDFIVAAVAILAIALVGADCWMLSSRLESARRDAALRIPLDEELRRLDACANALREELAALRARRETEETAQRRVDALRSAIPDVLGAIASECGGRIVVKEISTAAPYEITLVGVAATVESAADMMARLGDAVAAKGWRLAPGAIASNESRTMVDFSCRISFAQTKEVE